MKFRGLQNKYVVTSRMAWMMMWLIYGGPNAPDDGITEVQVLGEHICDGITVVHRSDVRT